MKKGILIMAILAGIGMFSCGNSPATEKMTDELCEAMEKFTPDEPMSKYDAANDMNAIKKNQAYKDVKEGQIKKSMMKKCPEGWKKYLDIKDK